MDETGLWNDAVSKKSYSPVNTTPMEITSGK
jgi:hypothetical protein